MQFWDSKMQCFFRDFIEKHNNEKHPGTAPNVQTLREMDQSEVEKLNNAAKYSGTTTSGNFRDRNQVLLADSV